MLKNIKPRTKPRAGASPQQRIRAVLLALLSLLAASPMVLAAPARADSSDGLVLWYQLNEQSGSVATDSSGYGHDGTVNGIATWGGDQGLTFDGSDTYIKVPDNIMAGLTSITVAYDVWIDPSQTGSYFTYGFGNSSSGSGNGYLFNTGDPLRAAITPSDFTHDQNTQQSTSLPRGTWKHVTYTQTGTTGILYADGAEVARNTSVTVTPGSIGGGTTTADYIGRSLFSSDHYFKGKIRDFRVYNRALSATEVQAVSAANWEEVQALATYNGALDAFEDPTVGPVIIFPSDTTADINNLQRPPNWTDSTGATPTSWPTPTTAKSPTFTAAQITALQDALYVAIQPNGDTTYNLSVHYDGMSDRVVAQTNAPSSITGPLATQYSGQLVFDTSTPPATAPSACPAAQGPTPAGTLADPLTQLQELANYNCALGYFEDPTIGPVLVFPSDYAGDINNLQTPSGWTDSTGASPTSWPTPTTSKSPTFTAAQIQQTTDAVYNKIAPNGSITYGASVTYDGPSDRLIVTTNAPPTLTGALTTQYPGKLVIKTTAPTCSAAQGPTPTGAMSDPLTQLRELANYNCALGYFEDPTIGPVLVFPSDYAGDINNLQTPSGWTDSTGASPTSWPTPTTSKSPTLTAEQVQQITDAAVAQIQPGGNTTYSVSVHYDAPSDRMVVVTNAPSTVTDPLLNAYPGEITLQAPPA